jgi:hypothetical protein
MDGLSKKYAYISSFIFPQLTLVDSTWSESHPSSISAMHSSCPGWSPQSPSRRNVGNSIWLSLPPLCLSGRVRAYTCGQQRPHEHEHGGYRERPASEPARVCRVSKPRRYFCATKSLASVLFQESGAGILPGNVQTQHVFAKCSRGSVGYEHPCCCRAHVRDPSSDVLSLTSTPCNQLHVRRTNLLAFGSVMCPASWVLQVCIHTSQYAHDAHRHPARQCMVLCWINASLSLSYSGVCQ